VERLLPRWQLRLLPGDVVVAREPLPRVNPRPISDEPQWRYRVAVQGEPPPGQTFTTFLHAASRAEELAVARQTRLMFLEDDVASLLADYRRHVQAARSRDAERGRQRHSAAIGRDDEV
jgi:hypothetical protein